MAENTDRPQLDVMSSATPNATLPNHVRDSFHVPPQAQPQQLGAAWDYGWLLDTVVLIQVSQPDRAAWSSRLRENLQVPGVRIVRPVRSTDGRFINAGWRASHYVAGNLAARVDETVAAALRLDTALAEVPIPDIFNQGVDQQDVFAVADKAAWRDEHDTVVLDPSIPAHEMVATIVPKVRDLLRPFVEKRAMQVTHADMLATTIYAGTQPPTVTDIVGVAHPHGYTAAQTIVDALIMNATDARIIDRFSQIPELPQLLLRALLYRLYVHALHPQATSNTGTNLEWAAQTIMSRVRGTI